jgi:hypothetical protein
MTNALDSLHKDLPEEIIPLNKSSSGKWGWSDCEPQSHPTSNHANTNRDPSTSLSNKGKGKSGKN